MAKVETLKKALHLTNDLKGMVNILEQLAARDISTMREQILQSRPFFQELWRINKIVKEISQTAPDVVHKHLVVSILIDWGMPGDLLSRVIEKSIEFSREHDADILVAGKMGHSYFKDITDRTIHYFSLPKKPNLRDVESLYEVVAGYAHVTYIYPKFVSLSRQTVQLASTNSDIQPIKIDNDDDRSTTDIESKRFIIEPDPKAVANYINKAVTGLAVLHYMNEAQLSYSAAQMVAMRRAHENAKEEVVSLTTQYYKAKREVVDNKLRELYRTRVTTKGNS